MKLTPIKCIQCGASINIDSMPIILKCPYCGTSYMADYRNSSPKNEQSIFSSKDNPINIQISRIDKPIIRANFYLTSMKGRNDLLFFIQTMSILSYYTKLEFICVTSDSVNFNCFRYSHDKKKTVHQVDDRANKVSNNDSNVIKRRLVEWGFEVSERWVKNNDEKIIEMGMRYDKIGFTMTYYIDGMIRISPSMHSTCWNEELSNIVQRLSSNDVCSQIAEDICDDMIKKENYHIQNHVEGICHYSFSVDKSCVRFTNKSYTFHTLGFNDLEDDKIYKAFCLNLLIKILNRFNNHWMLNSIPTGNIELVLETQLKKEYKNW